MKSKEEIEKEIEDVDEKLSRCEFRVQLDGTDVLSRQLVDKHAAVKNALEWVLGEEEDQETMQMHKEFNRWLKKDFPVAGQSKKNVTTAWRAAWKRSRELLAEDRAEGKRKVYKLNPTGAESQKKDFPFYFYSIDKIKTFYGGRKYFKIFEKWWSRTRSLGECDLTTIAFNAFWLGHLASKNQANKGD